MNWIKTINLLIFTLVSTCVFAQNTRIVDGKTYQVHTIGKGETLSKITTSYKITLAELKKANKGLTEKIQAGQELLIPSGKNRDEQEDKGVHIVKKGETLSVIAGKYKVSVGDVRAWNNLKGSSIAEGQKLIVSAPQSQVQESVSKPVPASNEQANSASNQNTHLVAKGETFYSIARKYNVKPGDLKKVNNLTNLSLKEGQSLIIPGAIDVQVNKPEKPQPMISPVISNPKPAEPQVVKQEPTKIEPAKTETITETQINQTAGTLSRSITNSLGYERVTETGLAEFIDDNLDSQKHLCLHKTAPIGSILQVKNELNGAVIFVKVVGKLPETGNNDRLIIKISKRAYEKLGATGKRFPVEVNYPSPL